MTKPKPVAPWTTAAKEMIEADAAKSGSSGIDQ